MGSARLIRSLARKLAPLKLTKLALRRRDAPEHSDTPQVPLATADASDDLVHCADAVDSSRQHRTDSGIELFHQGSCQCRYQRPKDTNYQSDNIDKPTRASSDTPTESSDSASPEPSSDVVKPLSGDHAARYGRCVPAELAALALSNASSSTTKPRNSDALMRCPWSSSSNRPHAPLKRAASVPNLRTLPQGANRSGAPPTFGQPFSQGRPGGAHWDSAQKARRGTSRSSCGNGNGRKGPQNGGLKLEVPKQKTTGRFPCVFHRPNSGTDPTKKCHKLKEYISQLL